MRRENHAKTIRAVESVANQKYVAQGIRQDIKHELIGLTMVRNGERRQIRTRCREPIAASTLEIDPFAGADKIEAQISNLRVTG